MSSPEVIGTTIAGRYRVRRKLGEGGMGAVWLVQHTESLQSFALKTLHAPKGGFDRMTLDRFLREARAAAALRTRNVVKVIDAQMSYVHPPTNAPLPFIVMELLEGETLEERIRTHGSLPHAQLVWVMKQIARALDLAHGKGIVHRDLKPENLFLALDEDGEPIVKVCDFGIAKLGGELGEGMMATSTTGAFLGTPLYMSPEQAKNATSVVPQSDQWALGLIAFKALTGRDYFRDARSGAELVVRIVTEPLTPPTTYAPSLPDAFDAWFSRSCAREVNARWSSVGEQMEALATALGVTREEAPKLDLAAVRIVSTHDANPSAPTEELTGIREKQMENSLFGERAEGVFRETSSEASVPRRAVLEATSAPAAIAASTTNGANSVPSLRPKTKGVGARAAWWVLAGLVALGVGVVVVRARHVDRSTSPSNEPAPTTSSTTTPATSSAPSSPPTSTPSSTPPSSTVESAAPIASTVAPTATIPSTLSPKSTTKPKPPKLAPSTSSKPTPAAALKPKGASCARSAECASGFCVAEECT